MGTHILKFNKMIYITYFTLHAFIIMRKTHSLCAGITYGIDVQWSNSAFEDAFWSTVLRWRKARVVLDRAAETDTLWSHRNPAGDALYWYFSPLDIFASMPLAQFESVGQRYVAIRENNRFTDWAIRLYREWAKLNI